MLKNIYIYNVQAFQETYNTFKQVYLKKDWELQALC